MSCNQKAYEVVSISGRYSKSARFLYRTIPGRLLLGCVVKPRVSRFAGAIADSGVSRVFIRGFIKRNCIKMEDFQEAKYRSFNAFFSRKVRPELRPFPTNGSELAAPCDGKLTVYPITADGVFNIKNSMYSIEELLCDNVLAREFIGGVCLIFRLTPDDYHRYAYIDDGSSEQYKQISGVLHTVRPIAQERYKVFLRNSREYEVMDTVNFGRVVQMEVGALFVGRIVNRDISDSKRQFKRGDEKGMFEFGGSTVVMLFQKDAVVLDEVFYKNTRENKETIVRMGNRIGVKHV